MSHPPNYQCSISPIRKRLTCYKVNNIKLEIHQPVQLLTPSKLVSHYWIRCVDRTRFLYQRLVASPQSSKQQYVVSRWPILVLSGESNTLGLHSFQMEQGQKTFSCEWVVSKWSLRSCVVMVRRVQTDPPIGRLTLIINKNLSSFENLSDPLYL